jgi:hypothetical protein
MTESLVGELEVGGGLDETVFTAVQEIFAEGFEAGADLSELLGSLLFAAVGLGEAALEHLVALLQRADDLLELGHPCVLGRASDHSGRQPEGDGKKRSV